ncbi:MAG: RNA methyltransferase [Nitratireductor sp.]|nr:RNA methyltransferase [Nitratireductor sp.]MCB1460408.1 RNA methyltransferase [Nitratireductor sp.]
MSDTPSDKPPRAGRGPSRPSDAHNSHHAEKRRKRRDQVRARRGDDPVDPGNRRQRPHVEGSGPQLEGHVFLYGLHTVRHALSNEKRIKVHLHITANARERLGLAADVLSGIPVTEAMPRDLDRLVGSDAVHQGVVLEAEPLRQRSLEELAQSRLLLVLDQVTDPHNVGAILRSAVAFGAGALITTARHSPQESGVLAKAASGALDMMDHVSVRNLAETLEELAALGYQTVGLDSEGPHILEDSLAGDRVALVLGAEGKGLRQKTRQTCATLARIDLPGEIKSLNVSNAAALSLYVTRRFLDR